jgi:hypothetical protein
MTISTLISLEYLWRKLRDTNHWQGDRARYIGWRKNLFDLRRVAVVHNLHVIARMDELANQPQAD